MVLWTTLPLSTRQPFPKPDWDLLHRAAASIYREIQERQMPLRPIHGDSTSPNAVSSQSGPLWFDWEEAFRGPVTRHLACLVTRGRVLGEAPDICEALLDGYRPEAVETAALSVLVDARVFETAVWRARPVPASYQIDWAERDERLRWLRARYGD